MLWAVLRFARGMEICSQPLLIAHVADLFVCLVRLRLLAAERLGPQEQRTTPLYDSCFLLSPLNLHSLHIIRAI